ncbi:hypothetical protein [Paenibacillus sp. URB8-2]|uniref:hypothetical protein n=1 Tax=Paenibacillus sp. URB8-2 TaxID=2741301 RepID=UPI0015B83B20|nr:hypothetical protein [Paenibacillus sp. URB8-2]BCG58069.1 hypothetical protein PUR_14940 [Paenibacillus sp. URB8-2]
MHHDSYGAREALHEGDSIVWTTLETGGTRYAALFNTGETPLDYAILPEQIGFTGWTGGMELWSRQPAVVRDGCLTATVPPHGVRLYRF